MKSRILAVSLAALLGSTAVAFADDIAIATQTTVNSAPVSNVGSIDSTFAIGGFASNTINATGALSQTSITSVTPGASVASASQVTSNSGAVSNVGVISATSAVGNFATNSITAIGAGSVVSINAGR